MRTLVAVMIGVVLFSTSTTPEPTRIAAVAVDTVATSEVRRGSEIGQLSGFDDLSDALFVERPAGAIEGAKSSVFLVHADGVRLQRVAVEYGRASTSLIQIVSGVSRGHRIVVSDMRAWDAFQWLELRH